MMLGIPLSATDAAIFESLVVPRYTHAFAAPALAMLLPFQPAIVAHLGCRTGFPAQAVTDRLPGCTLCGMDSSPAALELARTKASLLTGSLFNYVHTESLPAPFRAGDFTHALALHPPSVHGSYRDVLCEQYRLLASGGQVVLAVPLRGSFASLYDLLREYAVRHSRPDFGTAIDAACTTRPNPETLAMQCEQVGFVDVDVAVDLLAVPFESGRAFVDDPISRLVVAPDVMSSLPVTEGTEDAMRYVASAIVKYWSAIDFELTVNIGCVSARKP